MPEDAFNHDEIYAEARVSCNKENLDGQLARLHALAFEAAHNTALTTRYDTSLSSRYDPIHEERIDTLFSFEQRDRLREVFSMDELQAIKSKYYSVVQRLREQTRRFNEVRSEANKRAMFIIKVRGDLFRLQQLAASTEIVVERLEHEIESLELAIAFDQERACF